MGCEAQFTSYNTGFGQQVFFNKCYFQNIILSPI